MTNVADKSYRENQTTFQVHFPPQKSCSLFRWENVVEADRSAMTMQYGVKKMQFTR